jgi:hypothetical protein
MSEDEQNMINAAISIGFIECKDDTLICNKKQLVEYTASVARAVIEQIQQLNK